MHSTSRRFAVASLALALSGAAFAADPHATKDEAVALVKKAVAEYKSAGRDKAFADFNVKGGRFTDRDLYIFVSDFTGKGVANGANEKLIGRDLFALKDVDGKAFVAEYVERAKSGKAGWTDYKWPNPVTKEVEAKSSYCEPVDNVAICAGIYK